VLRPRQLQVAKTHPIRAPGARTRGVSGSREAAHPQAVSSMGRCLAPDAARGARGDTPSFGDSTTSTRSIGPGRGPARYFSMLRAAYSKASSSVDTTVAVRTCAPLRWHGCGAPPPSNSPNRGGAARRCGGKSVRSLRRPNPQHLARPGQSSY
jgi:hypothetical protein